MLLRLTALLSFLSIAWAAPTATSDPGYNCRPGQPCWPSVQEWQQFNTSIDGHLYQTIPLGAPCYQNSSYYDVATCDVVESVYNNSIPRGSYYGETYWLNWEACGLSGCSLLGSNPEETLYNNCSLGSLAPYYVDARNASHISAALQFAHVHNIRISIKNTGHDFFGRSMALNSLAIWTHNLDTLAFYQNFTAFNCPSANSQNVGEMGAGVIAGDAYQYFSTQGMDITGGYEASVGIAGGFGQGGGLGSFTTIYGLMVDNAVEFEVITADGEVRVINECNDPELFWAMRGGGGGTFAVLTKYRVQLFPSLPIHVYTFNAEFTGVSTIFNASQNQGLRDVMTAHVNSQLEWSAQLVTGQIEYFPNKFSISLVSVYGDDGSKLKSATASFAQFLNNRTDLTVSENSYISYPNYAAYLTVTEAVAGATEPPGIFSLLSSRLIPRSVFAAPNTSAALVDGVIEGIATARSLTPRTGTQVVVESPLSNLDTNNETSAHPAWRDAIWHVIHVAEWDEPLAPAVQKNLNDGFLQLLSPLKALTPNGGAYFNEAHYGEPQWQETFFGSKYDALLEIKHQYDSTHLFDCWKCVGWRGEEE
ncbi:hypothetical protein H0H92_009354 [Tricholoma furcatifolium]|nr:hypothetical protein H0H92_009354 [Tricholoma furcatifolium]